MTEESYPPMWSEEERFVFFLWFTLDKIGPRFTELDICRNCTDVTLWDDSGMIERLSVEASTYIRYELTLQALRKLIHLGHLQVIGKRRVRDHLIPEFQITSNGLRRCAEMEENGGLE